MTLSFAVVVDGVVVKTLYVRAGPDAGVCVSMVSGQGFTAESVRP